MMLERRVWDIVMRVRKGRSEGRDERRGWGGYVEWKMRDGDILRERCWVWL